MYCKKLFDGLDTRLDQKKTIDEIANELCPEISKKRDKIIGLIKTHRGGDYLMQNHKWLGYHINCIRNPSGGAGMKSEPPQNPRLNKSSLKTTAPSTYQYKQWIMCLDEIITKINGLENEFTNTTSAKYILKLRGLSKRTKEIRMILDGNNRF